LAERVIFRELYQRGLTAVDDVDDVTLGVRPTMSHVTARLEIQTCSVQSCLATCDQAPQRSATPRDRDYGASRTSENLSKVIAKSAARQRAVVLAAAFAALEIEDRPDFFAVQKVGRPAISLFNQSLQDIIPVLAFARSGELHGPPKYLLVLLSHRVVLLPHRASGVGLAIIPQG
jgi:ATPase MipZ